MDAKSILKELWNDRNIPNVITLLRIPILIIMYFVSRDVILWLVVLSIITDILDGVVARKFNLITNTGKWLDPACDKLTQIALMFILCSNGYQIFIFLIFELMLLYFGYLVICNGNKYVPSTVVGKVITILFYVLIFINLIFRLDIFLIISSLSIVRFIYYIRKYLKEV